MHKDNSPTVSIILPTYNESQNILGILKSIRQNIPTNLKTQAIVVDDNSPDGTGKIVEDYINTIKRFANYTVDVIHRTTKDGLGSAIIHGIQKAKGDTIIVMDTDYSHPPQIIPKLINTIHNSKCDLAIASRYVNGGKIVGWPLKRKIMSKFATILAKKGLHINTHDPMSGFFAFRKNIINEIKFDGIGYKLLLEFLVKVKDIKIQEIPYTFENRQFGSSKLTAKIIIDYLKSTWKLYRYGKSLEKAEKRDSVKFLSKAGRFYTVGAIGFAVNYLVSLLFVNSIPEFWYIHATIFGIGVSMTSNFILNKRYLL